MSDEKIAPGPTACQPEQLHPLPGFIHRRSLNLFCGASGIGKSALMAMMLRDFRDQRPIYGHRPNPVSGIGLVLADRTWEQGARQWFERAGFPEIRCYSITDDRGFDLRRFRQKKWERPQLLLECIDKLKLTAGGLVAIDPMALFFGGNLLDYDVVACAALEIQRGLADRDVAALGLAHTAKIKSDPKAGYARAQDKILGTAALGAYTSTQMALISPEESGDPYYSFSWHTHLTKSVAFRLERDEQTGLFLPYSGASEMNSLRVMALFPDDATPIEFKVLVELADALPMSKATLKRVLAVLQEHEQIEKTGHGFYRRVIAH